MKISVPKKGIFKVAWAADLHCPYQDNKAVELAEKIVEKYSPDVLILGGDWLDAVGVSRFSKQPLDPNTNNFQRELDSFQLVLSGFVGAAGKAKKVFLPGNHEARVGKLLRDRAPALLGLEALQLPNLLKLSEYGISMINSVSIGGVVFTHGDLVRKGSGMSVMAAMESMSYAYSNVIGHCHRMGMVYKSRPGLPPIFGMESGHLSDPKKLDYLNGGFMNWQLGMSVVTFVDGIAIPEAVPFYRSNGGLSAAVPSHFSVLRV